MDNETINQENVTDIDALEDTVNALVDGNTNTDDNNTDSAVINTEETLKEMQTRLDDLASTNERLTAMVGKMVTAYGARLSESNEGKGVEAFPSTVEKSFDKSTEESNIPLLGDIVLGS